MRQDRTQGRNDLGIGAVRAAVQQRDLRSVLASRLGTRDAAFAPRRDRQGEGPGARLPRDDRDVHEPYPGGSTIAHHDNFQRLKIVSAENDSGWLPHYVYRADHAWDKFGK